EGTNVVINYGHTFDPASANGNVFWVGPNASNFASNGTYENWLTKGFDTNGLFANPYLRDPDNGDLRLAVDSPAKDLTQAILVQRDIFGTFRPVGLAVDSGAEEVAPSVPGIGIRSLAGERVRQGGSMELDRFGENVPLRYRLRIINER